MAGAVGAEGRVAHTAGVSHGMARLAGCIKFTVMERNPIGIQVAGGFNTARHLNIGHQLVAGGNHRNGMAQVAFQADGLLVCRQVLAIVAAEASRRFLVRQVIGLHTPVGFLVNKDILAIGFLDFSHRLIN